MPEATRAATSLPSATPLPEGTRLGTATPIPHLPLLRNQNVPGFYVRYFRPFPPVDAEQWTLKIGGLVSDPQELTVVSDDRRIRSAAQGRGVRAVGVASFMAALERGTFRTGHAPAEPQRKLTGPTPEESRRWVEEFKDLAADPEFKDWLGAPGIDPDEFVP